MRDLDTATTEILAKCAWCSQELFQSREYMLCAKLPVGYPMKAGVVVLPVELKTSKRIAHASVSQPGSESKRQGYDIAFGLCCEKCAASLAKAIEEDAAGFELFN